MAPARNRKPKSLSEDKTKHGSARPQQVAIRSPARTPIQSPTKRIIKITQGQKQALIDNLQLEVTERARKLRAQYALQAQSLRTRIELRVNRIPNALRKANMGELLAKYQESTHQPQPTASANIPTIKTTRGALAPQRTISTTKEAKSSAQTRPRGNKRNSDIMENANKENASEDPHYLPNPKKRTKVAAIAPPTREPPNPSTILSPKSSNSRTFPQSPIRPALGSPQKSYLSRPVSPLKSTLPANPSPSRTAAVAATADLASLLNEKSKPARSRTAVGGRKTTNPTAVAKSAATRSKRGAIQVATDAIENRCVSNSSNTSTASTGTTVTKKRGKAAPIVAATAAAKKKNLHVGVSAAGRKVGVTAEATPAAGRRVLRKRA